MSYKEKNRQKKRHQIAFRRFLKGEHIHYQIRGYVSIDFLELRRYIESKMVDGMTWDNYGSYWVVDHIVPLRLFDVFNEEELRVAWNYQNLMPLKKQDNLDKEGDIRFSKIVLSKMEQTFIVKKLLSKIDDAMYKMDIYLNK